MKLRAWMKERGKTQADLAEVIGRDKTRANRICNGAIPNEDEMPLIVAWTHRLVQPNDFYDVTLPETRVLEAEQRNT
jgi:transcriptional regulator with XRE-family HTH domain